MGAALSQNKATAPAGRVVTSAFLFLNTVSSSGVGSRTAGKQRSKTAIYDRPGRRAHELGLRFGTPLRLHRCSCPVDEARQPAAGRRATRQGDVPTPMPPSHVATAAAPSAFASPFARPASSTALGRWRPYSVAGPLVPRPIHGRSCQRGRRSNRRRLQAAAARRGGPHRWADVRHERSAGRKPPHAYGPLRVASACPRVRDRPGRSGHRVAAWANPSYASIPRWMIAERDGGGAGALTALHRSVPT